MDILNSNNYNNINSSDYFYFKELINLKEEISFRDEKLDLLLNFALNLQKKVINSKTDFIAFQNLDLSSLKHKLNEIQDYISLHLKKENEINEKYIIKEIDVI